MNTAARPAILVLQHVAVEDLGYLQDLLLRDGFVLTTVRLDLGEKIPPDLRAFDAMFSMGGPMDTWMGRAFPWLADERRAIGEFVTGLHKPFIGFCLGCQLLGEALGGDVVRCSSPEVGIFDVRLAAAAANDGIFSGFPATFRALHWHSWEVANLEANADVTLLGSSDAVKYQLFKYREHAYGIQFHLEIKEHTVAAWGGVPEYREALHRSLGENGLDVFDAAARDSLKDINRCADVLYQGFKGMLK